MSESLIASVDDMSPDGVRIAVEWDKWELGASVFVPALAVDTAISQFNAHAARRGWALITQIVVEDGLLGVRAWRVEHENNSESEREGGVESVS